MLDTAYLTELRDLYQRELLGNVMPFWATHVCDRECGGYHTCLDRDGTVYDYDKLCMWHAGRVIWTFSHLYLEFQQNPEWLEVAQWGVDFVQQHGFAPDGSMYYALTRDGRPLQPAQDVYTDLSTAAGFGEYARATQDDALYAQARALLLRVWEQVGKPGAAFQPFDPTTRPVRVHGHSMITLNVVQELRRYAAEPAYEHMIDECLRRIVDLHTQRDRRAVFELVSWDGGPIPGSSGRWINPGHMIEGGTFIIHEGQRRGDDRLVQTGIDLIDWGFEWGWDKEFGGIFNDVDSEGLPVPTADVLRYDSKLWWQHVEALYGTLLAYCLTEDEQFLDAYRLTHEYSFSRFADPEHGEWLGVLDRRGNPIGHAKGTSRKSPYHIARNFHLCHRLLRATLGG